jgi:hypothetical protein
MTEPATANLLTNDALNKAVADLTRAGVTNSDAATRIARALAKNRVILGDLIAGETACDTWPKFLAGAFDRATAMDQVDEGRKTLDRALKNAEQAIEQVIRVRAQLTGPLYDVEHAEGDNLFPHYLEKAYRAIRTATQLNPTRGM